MKNENQQPEEISDAMLLAYLANDVSDSVRQQIEADEGLLARVRELNKWEQLIMVAYDEMSCPLPEELLRYHYGLLDRNRMRAIRQHLEQSMACGCAEELTQLAAVSGQRTDPRGDYLWERVKATGKRLLEAIQIKGLEQPTMVLRGREPERRAFRAGEYLVVLMLTPPLTQDDSWQLEGQITKEGQVGPELQGEAQITLAGQVVARDRVDEFGYFNMSEVPAGNIGLHIETADIILKPIEFEL